MKIFNAKIASNSVKFSVKLVENALAFKIPNNFKLTHLHSFLNQSYQFKRQFTMDLNNNKENFARILWRSADCVCFDVDSTVCRDEAIDELARFANKEKQVQEL